MTTSPILGLPFIAQQQATPEVTHNEALTMLAALLYGATALQNAPPGSPSAGDSYICGTSPTGAWAGKANCIAVYTSGGWRFVPGFDSNGSQIAPGAGQEGLRVWNKALDCAMVWTGAAWVTDGGAMETTTVAAVGAATGPKRWKYISDETGGAVPAFNDGTNWRRATDRAVIS